VTATSSAHGKAGSSLRARATRAAILEHAARLFAMKGFEGTSLQDIAESSGLTRPAVYHYFASKDEMLATLVAETSGLAAEKLAAIRQDPKLDSTAKLRAVTAAIVQQRLDAPEQFRMLERSEDSLPEPTASQHRAARRAVLAEVSGVLHEGILSGEFRPCDERLGALSVLGMCNWVAWWYRPGSASSPDAVIEELANNATSMFARAEHRVPKTAGLPGAFAMLRHDLDYLERLTTENTATNADLVADHGKAGKQSRAKTE
jgi:AcrR family transcriptional regulator